MTTTTLTDRYVHATTRWMAEARRDDIARELRASIDDMVTGRVEAGEPEADAEREVLTDLGDPAALAAQYGNQPLHLIGPRYFLLWRRLTFLGLIWIPATIGVIAALAELASNDNPASVIGHGVLVAIQTAVHVVFWSTLAFAILERVDVDAKLPGWSVDRLPEVPQKQQIGLAEMISGVFVTGLVIAVLVLQQFRSWVEGPGGDDVPVLDPDLWSFWLPLLIAVLVVSMAFEVVKYRIGSFTWPVVAGTAVISLGWVVPFVYLAANDMLLSREFVAALDITPTMLDTINLGIVVVGVAVEVGTVIDAVVKNRKASRTPVVEV